jgi:hypothetical protein
MDRNVAVALPAPVSSMTPSGVPGHLRLADVFDLDTIDGETGDGPTRLFSPDPSYRGPGAETAVTSASEPAPVAPADDHLCDGHVSDAHVSDAQQDPHARGVLLMPAAREVTAVSVAPVDRTLVSTPAVPSHTHVTERPVMRTPDASGTQVNRHPVLLTPAPSGTQVTAHPVLRSPEPSPVETIAPALGVPSPIALDQTHLRTTPVRAARIIIGGRYLADGGDVVEYEHTLGSSMLLARTPSSPFADDPYVDAEHGALTFRPDGVAIEDFDSTNGVFVRVREKATLRCGDMFRAGEELLRFTALRNTRTAGRAPTLGSPDPGYWGRVDVMLSLDSNAASYPLDDAEVSFGQTDGHLQFPDDPYLGALHCSIRRADKGATLVDHGSPSGTWLRLRAGDVVPYGSELLVGQTRIRIEQD